MITLKHLGESSINEGELPADLQQILEATEESLIVEAVLGDIYGAEELSEENLEFNPELQALVESQILNERTIIRMDKNAKKNRVFKLALYSTLKKRNPKLFDKLKLVIKMKKSIIALAEQKYGNQAKILGNAMFRKAANKPKVRKALANKGKTLVVKPKKKVVSAAEVNKLINRVR